MREIFKAPGIFMRSAHLVRPTRLGLVLRLLQLAANCSELLTKVQELLVHGDCGGNGPCHCGAQACPRSYTR